MNYKSNLELAISQIGVHNDKDGSNKYIEWYYGRRINVPWCAIFQGWLFHENGIYDRLEGLDNVAGCEPWRRWAIKKGYWSKEPKPGALVLYDWNPSGGDGADHIGIVESVYSGGIVAIEGNTSTYGSQINGGHVLRKRRPDSLVMGYIHVDTTVRTKPEPVIGYERIYGKDRYNTAKATANTFNGRGNGYVLVSGKGFADGLSASYLAQQKKCSILLVDPYNIEDTIKYIKERTGTEVYIIGGEIPPQAEEMLEGYKVTRLAGKTRYETNMAVLEACETPNKQLIIASGQNFPDGLCAGTIYRPVMLVNKALKDYQRDWIERRGLDRFYVFGGESVVPENIIRELSEMGEVSRYAGDNRYATSKAIAKTFYPNANTVLLASGKEFADGLAAVNLGNYPLVLCDSSNTIEARKYISGIDIKKALAVGGKGALSDETVDWALTRLASMEGRA